MSQPAASQGPVVPPNSASSSQMTLSGTVSAFASYVVQVLSAAEPTIASNIHAMLMVAHATTPAESFLLLLAQTITDQLANGKASVCCTA